MAQNFDAAKRRVWSERLRRFDRCDLTVVEFCQAEGVSTPSFYEWRRKLRSPRGAVSSAVSPPPTFFPVRVVSSTPAAAPVEIHLPNGARVSLTGADVPLVAAAIVAAGRLRGGADQEEGLTC
jgi:transposase